MPWDLSLEQVQKWVVSVIVLAVACFPLGAMAAGIVTLDDQGRHGDATLLVVVMAALGVAALGAGRLVHRTRLLSPWLLLGVLPAVAVVLFLR